MTCEEIRRLLHEAHDDGRVGVPAEAVDHLAACEDCREFADELDVLARAFRALPRAPLPADALDAVWRKTTGGPRAARTTPAGIWRLAAAAVLVMALSVTTLYFVFSPAPPPRPSGVELAQTSAQAEMVLGYTARALAATRIAAADRVLASKVAPAVRGASTTHPSRRNR
jgi:predicted anti-sigma-YlaC factor YlaD